MDQVDGYRLWTAWLVCAMLPLVGACFAVAMLAVPEGHVQHGLHGGSIACMLATSIMLVWMRKVIVRLETVTRDLALVACLDLENVGTGGLDPSAFREINSLEMNLLSLVHVMYECRPYLPDQVVDAMERAAFSTYRVSEEGRVDEDSIHDDDPQPRWSFDSSLIHDVLPSKESSLALPGMLRVNDILAEASESAPHAPFPTPNPFEVDRPEAPWQTVRSLARSVRAVDVVPLRMDDEIPLAYSEYVSSPRGLPTAVSSETFPPKLLDDVTPPDPSPKTTPTLPAEPPPIPKLNLKLPERVRQQLRAPTDATEENSDFQRGFLSFAAAKLKYGDAPRVAAGDTLSTPSSSSIDDESATVPCEADTATLSSPATLPSAGSSSVGAPPPLPKDAPPPLSPWLAAIASGECVINNGTLIMADDAPQAAGSQQYTSPLSQYYGPEGRGGSANTTNRHVSFNVDPGSVSRPVTCPEPASARRGPNAVLPSFRGRVGHSSFAAGGGRTGFRGVARTFQGRERRRSSLNQDVVELCRRKINAQHLTSNPSSPMVRLDRLRSNFAGGTPATTATAARPGFETTGDSKRPPALTLPSQSDVLAMSKNAISPLMAPSQRARMAANETETASSPTRKQRRVSLLSPGLPALQCGMRKKKGTLMSVVFDVTELAEFDIQETFEVCSSFVGVVLDIIRAEQGEVCQFGANQVLCSWNTHVPCPQHPLSACRSALEIHHAIMAEPADAGGASPTAMTPMSARGLRKADSYAANNDDGGHWSISVASGRVFCGNIGTAQQRSPFVFGHVVEQVHLLNRLSMQCQAPMVIAGSTKSILHCPDLLLRPLDVVDWGAIGCRDTPREPVYELVSDACTVHLERWRQAFHAFLCGEYDAAFDMFKSLQMFQDPQMARMLRLAQAGVLNQLPVPYKRSASFWDVFETEAVACAEKNSPILLPTPRGKKKKKKKTTAISEALEAKRKEQKGNGTKRQASNLWSAIEEAQKKRDTEKGDGSESDTSSTCSSAGDEEPPVEFTDTTGARWRRSTRMIGSGAIGDVWLGMSGEGGFVAFKCVKLPKGTLERKPKGNNLGRRADAASDIHSIINEVELLSKHRHESIVSFISCGVYERYVIITMEYVSGGSLAGVIDHFGTLPEATVKRYTREILVGLRYLHGKNIIHCDLKPANVLIHTDGCCKLSDFGTSFKLSTVMESRGPEGTPLFMAPESCRGAPCPASDLWSLGLTVIQLLTAQTPFAWDEEISALQGLHFSRWLCKEEGPVPLPVLMLGKEALAFVQRVMVRDPDERTATDTLLYDMFVLQ